MWMIRRYVGGVGSANTLDTADGGGEDKLFCSGKSKPPPPFHGAKGQERCESPTNAGAVKASQQDDQLLAEINGIIKNLALAKEKQSLFFEVAIFAEANSGLDGKIANIINLPQEERATWVRKMCEQHATNTKYPFAIDYLVQLNKRLNVKK